MFEQDRVITRLQQRVLREPNIRVCFLSGSFGRRSQDAYSDLDVALVFASPDSRASAYTQRRAFAASVLPYVPVKSFDADHVRPYFHIALYANGTKADYRYEVQSELEPNYWDREIRILKDTAGWGEQFQADSARMPLPRETAISPEELEALDHRFWVMYWDIYRQLRRGDYEKPFEIYLQLLSMTLPPLLKLLPQSDLAFQGLLSLEYTRDTRQTLQQLQALLSAYLAARSAVARHHRLPFQPDHSFEREIQQLTQKA